MNRNVDPATDGAHQVASELKDGEERATGRVTVLGVFAADLTFRAERMPQIGETRSATGFAIGAGGKGSNQAVAAARAGASVAIVTRIGADAFGELARSTWSRNRIAQQAVSVDQGAPTGTAFVFVSTLTGNNAILIESGAAGQMTIEDVRRAEDVIAGASVFITQLEQPLALALEGLRIARRHGVTTILNPAPAMTLSDEVYALCDYLTPNESEAAILTGIPITDEASAIRAARFLIDRGVANVVMTLGEKGALLFNEHQVKLFPSMANASVVDTSGAGDAFNGGLAVALAEGRPIVEAIAVANTVAGLSIGKPGTAAAMPLRSEIDGAMAADGFR